MRLQESVTFGTVALAFRTFLGDSGRAAGRQGAGATDGQDLLPTREASAVSWLQDVIGDHPGLQTSAFEEDRAVMRGEFAQLLYLFAGEPDAPGRIPFADVSTGDPFIAAISWLYDADISRGWGNARGLPDFRPAVPVTRETLAIMLSRYRGNHRPTLAE
ncbi:S-layer homology domain-containing protein [Microbacterium sp. HD4P20]|uniref:S-layer homology domain-containing protein n=1 Tax=Microbacterium sp. HD4P20 TaxID=2864874 RepID=UPI0035AB8F18